MAILRAEKSSARTAQVTPMDELLSTFDAKTWRKVCDEECLPDDHWIREAPRPQGPMGKCGCEWCAATRRYLELQPSSAGADPK